MNDLNFRLPNLAMPAFSAEALLKKLQPFVLLLTLLAIWSFAPDWLRRVDETVGSVDQSIWLLVVLSLISFLLITGLCWWLLKSFWGMASLPPFKMMVLQFNTLKLWQQLTFYWLSFALLLLVAMGSLIAIV